MSFLKTIDASHFGDDQAKRTIRALDYLDGDQKRYVVRALNGDAEFGAGKRYSWVERGFDPKVRNITEPIVTKSAGSLFVTMPKLEILPATSPTAPPVVDARFNELLTIADAHDFLQNLNILSRYLKSVCVLVEKVVGAARIEQEGYRFDPARGDLLVLQVLHRGNTVVRMNPTRKRVTELAYLTTGCPDDDEWEYRYYGPAGILDVRVVDGEEFQTFVAELDGGVVPAIMHYDVRKPRTGIWHGVPEDLISFQEWTNAHLTDLARAMAAQLAPSLFTDAEFKNPGQAEPVARAGAQERASTLAQPQAPGSKAIGGGIGSIIQLKSKPGDTKTPFLQYLGPDVDLSGQQAVMDSMMRAIATDWCVNLKTAGSGSAASGFQLIVEEMDNLSLREQRTISFGATLGTMYSVLQLLYPELTRGELVAQWPDAAMPVNKRDELDIWVAKINGGLATRQDYLMQVEGLDAEEAAARVQAIDENTKPTLNDLPALMTLLGKGVITPQQFGEEVVRRGVLAEGTDIKLTPAQVTLTTAPKESGVPAAD